MLSLRFALSALLVGGTLAVCQDPGRPIRPITPVGIDYAYVFNNTPETARISIVSARGAIHGSVRPNAYVRFGYFVDGRPRVLVSFAPSGEVLSSRPIELFSGNAYDVAYGFGTGPAFMMEERTVTGPDGKTRKETVKVPAPRTGGAAPAGPDKGKKATPKTFDSLRESP